MNKVFNYFENQEKKKNFIKTISKVMNFLILATFVYFLASCNSIKEHKKSDMLFNDSDVVYMYIYKTDSISEESKIIDSLKLLNSGNENSLVLYHDVDSICKTVDGIVYLNIFKLNNEKFGVIIDTTTKVYKFNHGKFERIITMSGDLGFSVVEAQKIDINEDSYIDILFKIPSGGTYGDGYICLFYNPVEKTLIYDEKTELANIKLDIKGKKVECFYSHSSIVYAIDKFSFRKIEQKKY